MPAAYYQEWAVKEFWGCAKTARGPVDGKPQRRNRIKLPVCPLNCFHAIFHEWLRQGLAIDIDRTKPGKEVYCLCQDKLSAIEEYLCFEKRFSKPQREKGEAKGFANCRKSTKKGVDFYNIIFKIEATLTVTKSSSVLEAYTFVGCLNPLATTHFPAAFASTPENLCTLEEYFRAFPIRLKTNGYTVDRTLTKLCIQFAKQSARNVSTTDNQQRRELPVPTTTASTSNWFTHPGEEVD